MREENFGKPHAGTLGNSEHRPGDAYYLILLYHVMMLSPYAVEALTIFAHF
jgi:hypothetical protein